MRIVQKMAQMNKVVFLAMLILVEKLTTKQVNFLKTDLDNRRGVVVICKVKQALTNLRMVATEAERVLMRSTTVKLLRIDIVITPLKS